MPVNGENMFDDFMRIFFVIQSGAYSLYGPEFVTASLR